MARTRNRPWGICRASAFENLFRNGLDEQGRIIGANGKRPVLKNVSREEVQAFMQQVELVPMIGEENPENVSDQIRSCAERNLALTHTRSRKRPSNAYRCRSRNA